MTRFLPTQRRVMPARRVVGRRVPVVRSFVRWVAGAASGLAVAVWHLPVAFCLPATASPTDWGVFPVGRVAIVAGDSMQQLGSLLSGPLEQCAVESAQMRLDTAEARIRCTDGLWHLTWTLDPLLASGRDHEEWQVWQDNGNGQRSPRASKVITQRWPSWFARWSALRQAAHLQDVQSRQPQPSRLQAWLDQVEALLSANDVTGAKTLVAMVPALDNAKIGHCTDLGVLGTRLAVPAAVQAAASCLAALPVDPATSQVLLAALRGDAAAVADEVTAGQALSMPQPLKWPVIRLLAARRAWRAVGTVVRTVDLQHPPWGTTLEWRELALAALWDSEDTSAFATYAAEQAELGPSLAMRAAAVLATQGHQAQAMDVYVHMPWTEPAAEAVWRYLKRPLAQPTSAVLADNPVGEHIALLRRLPGGDLALLARSVMALEAGALTVAAEFLHQMSATARSSQRTQILQTQILHWLGQTAEATSSAKALWTRWPNQPEIADVVAMTLFAADRPAAKAVLQTAMDQIDPAADQAGWYARLKFRLRLVANPACESPWVPPGTGSELGCDSIDPVRPVWTTLTPLAKSLRPPLATGAAAACAGTLLLACLVYLRATRQSKS